MTKEDLLSSKRFTSIQALLWGLALLTVIPLSIHLAIGLNNRPIRDDFCFTIDAHQNGILGNVRYYYEGWTGTYTSTFFQSIVGLLKAWRFVPGILLTLWFITMVGFVHTLFLFIPPEKLPVRYQYPLTLVGAAYLLSTTIHSTTNTYQSIYWTSGAITYALPLIIFTFTLTIVLRYIRSASHHILTPHLALIAGLCMLAGGCSPLFAVAQVLIFGFLLLLSALFAPLKYRRVAVISLLTAFAFSTMAFLIILVAPGNATRQAVYDVYLSFWEQVIISAALSVKYMLQLHFTLPVVLVMSVVGGWLYMINRRRVPPINLLLTVALTILIMMAISMSGFFSTLYAMSSAPPARAMIVMHYGRILGAAVIGFALGYGLIPNLLNRGRNAPSRLVASGGLLVACTIIVFSNFQMLTTTITDAQQIANYAKEWDAVESLLFASDSDDVVRIEPFTDDFHEMIDLGSLRYYPEPQKCVSDYYQVKRIVMPPENRKADAW